MHSTLQRFAIRSVLGVLTRRTALAPLLLCLASCSLLTIQSPEKPLSARDLTARMVEHEYSAHFITAVDQTADSITAATDDPAVHLNALRWKIGASSASLRAASQLAPMLSVIDSWALAIQMRDFLSDGAGVTLFGTQQPQAVALAADLARDAESLTRRLTSADEFAADERFVTEYARANPIVNLKFARPSIVDAWLQQHGTQVKIIDTLGTVPEAMAEARDVVRMYGDTAPQQALWRIQLAAQESGVGGQDLQADFKRLDDHFAKLSTMVDTAPQRVDIVVRDLRAQFDSTLRELVAAIHAESAALSAEMNLQRQAAVDAINTERAAIAADASRVASQVVRDAGEEARRLVREALMAVIALAIILLGLPFAAGYLVGRARHKH
jgi:hypothetical protein